MTFEYPCLFPLGVSLGISYLEEDEASEDGQARHLRQAQLELAGHLRELLHLPTGLGRRLQRSCLPLQVFHICAPGLGLRVFRV